MAAVSHAGAGGDLCNVYLARSETSISPSIWQIVKRKKKGRPSKPNPPPEMDRQLHRSQNHRRIWIDSFINYYLAFDNIWDTHLPPVICNLSDLIVLDVTNNKMSEFLQILNLKNNSFQGTISESWMFGCALRMISLSENQLHGKVPKSLCNCTKLEFVDFGDNKMHDTFPTWLGALPELRVIIMRSNIFHGSIEKLGINDSEFPQLRIMDLSFNGFSSKLPWMFSQFLNFMEVFDEKLAYMETNLVWKEFWISSHFGSYDYSMKITNKGMEMIYSKILNIFRGIDLSNNHFEREIPTSIGNLKGLHLLSLANNNFTSSIPSSFGDLQQLESLDLSHNKLSGKIPQELVKLNFLSYSLMCRSTTCQELYLMGDSLIHSNTVHMKAIQG